MSETTPTYTITVTTALIDAVYEHFKSRLISGDFEIKEFRNQEAELSIDGYVFSFWVFPQLISLVQSDTLPNYMKIRLTNEQEQTLYKHVEQRYNNYVRRELIAKKERELEALKETL